MSTDSDKFNLTWEAYEKCTSTAFKELLDEQDFVDVTLVSDDNKEVKCHKVVLGSCSPKFKVILKRNVHEHPLIYLSGVQYQELNSLVKFMYLGQTEVAEEDLNSFMAAASKFQIKGLTNEQEGFRGEPKQEYQTASGDYKQEFKPEPTAYNEPSRYDQNSYQPDPFYQQQTFYSQALATINELPEYSGQFQEYQETSKLVQKPYNLEKKGSSLPQLKCEKCEYRSMDRTDLRSHLLTQHGAQKPKHMNVPGTSNPKNMNTTGVSNTKLLSATGISNPKLLSVPGTSTHKNMNALGTSTNTAGLSIPKNQNAVNKTSTSKLSTPQEGSKDSCYMCKWIYSKCRDSSLHEATNSSCKTCKWVYFKCREHTAL